MYKETKGGVLLLECRTCGQQWLLRVTEAQHQAFLHLAGTQTLEVQGDETHP